MESMPALVLISGLLCDEQLWERQIAGLSSFAEIAVADITKQDTIAGMAGAVLEKAAPRFLLAGFSLGGQVALEIMRTAPERVERLALLSTTHGGVLPPVEVAIHHAMEEIEREGLDPYLEAAFPSYVTAAHAKDPAIRCTFIEMAHAVGKDAGLRQMRALLAIAGPIVRPGQIQCPTVILGGQEDHRTTPAAHESLAAEIAGSALVLIDDSAHFTPLEQPEAVTAALKEWITG
jgi:pimeloyl-ACP methyl ester carboxylesterase